MQLNDEQMSAVTHPIGEPACLIAGAGSGKCLAYGTPVIMYDCTIKQVQDISNGELLLGPDGTPRTVFGVTSGVDEMYKVTPVKGDTWGCNSQHILSLRVSSTHKQKTYGQYLEMPLDKYLNTSDSFKRKVVKLWRPPLIEFSHMSVPVDPYFLGLWLGDGDTRLDSVTLTTLDSPVTDHLCMVANEWGLLVVPSLAEGKCPRYRLSSHENIGRSNPLIDAMRDLGLGEGKTIPQIYLRNSSEVRWKLLAGLLDSDGSYSTGCWDFISKLSNLAEGITFLARSLGLAAYISPCEKFCQTGGGGVYYRVSISGDTSNIPTKLFRKRGNSRRQIKDVKITGFNVSHLGRGDYYGFELDGDGLFLLGDFTVTHNTRVLTERVRWLITQGVPPRRICAVTFTNKAANELLGRLGLEEASFDIPKVSTIHSLALGAIRRDPVGFGLQQKVTPLDDYDQTQMLRRIVEREVDIKEKGISLGSYVYSLLEKMGFHRSRGLGFSGEYTDEIHERAQIEHAGYHALNPFDLQIWKAYEIEKQKNSVVDFDDMLHLVVRRLRTDASYCESMGKSYEHVLMDEAQDTNPVQWEFVNSLLSPTNKNFYAVGDLSQSIYAFNGAVPKILKDFSENWRGQIPKLYRIARNHRSLPRIVYLANHIQTKMHEVIPLKMQTFRGDENTKGTIELTRASLPLDIAMIIAGEIFKDNARKRDQIPYKENCILVRAARQVPDIESALVRHRIPYQVRGGRGLLQTEEIRDVLSYLRLATNPKDFTALARAVTVPKTGAGDATLEKIRKTANDKFDGNLIKGCTSVEKLSTFVQALEYIQKFSEYPVQALDKIIDYINYKTYVAAKYKKEPDKVKAKLENIERFRELVRNLSEDQKMSTEDLVFQLTLDRAREDDKDGMVTVSTIHSAKGLEWARVYVTNIVEGSLPHRFSMGSEEEIEEERRLFYVACTRAKDWLTLCVPAMVQNGSDTIRQKPSRFLIETGVLSE